jgi:hypothetical protein
MLLLMLLMSGACNGFAATQSVDGSYNLSF